MRGPTIIQCSRALGFSDPKFLSLSLKPFWSSSNPDFQLVDRSDEYLHTVADDFLRDNGHNLWGDGGRGLLYPDDLASITQHLVGILNRHRRNENDMRVRLRRQGSADAEDTDDQSPEDENHTGRLPIS